MKQLDVISLHTGLERLHGLDAAYLSSKSTTSFTYLVSPRGLPIHVGWFDNSRKSMGLAPNHYAITTFPENVRNMHHRLILGQAAGSAVATLMEEDSADYLEGYDDAPAVYSRTGIEQPKLAAVVRDQVMGACVLTATAGDLLATFAWENSYDVPAVEAYGRSFTEAGDYLTQIDHATLNAITR